MEPIVREMRPQTFSSSKARTIWGYFFARRLMLVPTWRTWLVLLVAAGAIFTWLFHRAYDFLAVNDPVPEGILVVEGYALDDMLQEAIAEFHRNHYDLLFVTGGPIDRGEPLSEYKTLPDLAVAIMAKKGMEQRLMQPVASPAVVKDRTYASAVALRQWLHDHNRDVTKINLFAAGFHARRSRLLFQEAFGSGVKVGVIAYEQDPAEARQWWRSSAGVRGMIDEGLAFFYARFLFRKPD
jgi:hypothetical protein